MSDPTQVDLKPGAPFGAGDSVLNPSMSGKIPLTFFVLKVSHASEVARLCAGRDLLAREDGGTPAWLVSELDLLFLHTRFCHQRAR